jgi:ribosomal protein S18 acetylase RimI-like enzyme
MNVQRIDTDSRVFGGSVLAIRDFAPNAAFAAFERGYIAEYDPIYVSCKVPLEDLAGIHFLEKAGFNLIECQIRSTIKLRRPYDVSAFPYDFQKITREEDLSDVLDIAGATFVHDRVSLDPCIAPGIAGARYREYVLNSFRSPDEAVYRLVDQLTDQVVAFKTHRYLGAGEVLLLLGGVHPDFKNLGLGPVNGFFEFNELMRMGVRRCTTHISAGNYPIFNLEIARLGFRVVCTFAVLRKLYR